jgi:Protein of unknown function (DUF2800)
VIPRVTASAMQRAVACPLSYHLPQIRETTALAEAGTSRHAEVETALRAYRNGDAEALEHYDPRLAAVVHQNVVHRDLVHSIERALIVDVEAMTVRDLGESQNRNYGELGPYEIPVTVDCVLTDHAGRPTVIDWKSRQRVASPHHNWQIKVQVLAVWLLFDKPRSMTGAVVYLDNWHGDWAHFLAESIEEIAVDAAAALARVRRATAESTPHKGEWCDYCPAAASCPANLAIVRAALPDDAMLARIDALSDSDAGELVPKIKLLQSTIERAREVLESRAKRTGLPLPNGKVWRLSEYEKTVTDHSKAEHMLESAGFTVPKKTITIAALREMKPT